MTEERNEQYDDCWQKVCDPDSILTFDDLVAALGEFFVLMVIESSLPNQCHLRRFNNI